MNLTDLDALAHMVGHNWLLVILGTIVTWLLVTRVVETTEAGARILGPLGKRIKSSYRKRQERYRQDVAQEAKLLAIELIPKVIPSDYQIVKDQLKNVIDRLGQLEIENNAMRGYIISDEEWHFHYDIWIAGGAKPDAGALPKRVPWMRFVEQWKTGWRPEGIASTQI